MATILRSLVSSKTREQNARSGQGRGRGAGNGGGRGGAAGDAPQPSPVSAADRDAVAREILATSFIPSWERLNETQFLTSPHSDEASVTSTVPSGAGPLPVEVEHLRLSYVNMHGTDRAALGQLLMTITGLLTSRIELPSTEALTDSALQSVDYSCAARFVGDVEAEPGFVNQYFLEQQLGSGRQGEVWRATDMESGDVRAVKIVPRAAAGGSVQLAALRHSLENEMQALAMCKNRHVLRLYEVIDSPEHPNVYFVMALCDGSVASIESDGTIVKARSPGTRFYLEEVTIIALHIAAGVVYLHERGIVHRDIKPDNLLVRGDTYCIGDLGACSRFVGGRQKSTDRGLSGLVRERLPRGTDAFQPPVRLGDGANELERLQRADIWALGVTLKSLLDGRLPYAVDGVSAADLREQIDRADFGFDVTTPSMRDVRTGARRAGGQGQARGRQSSAPDARLLWGDLLRTMLSTDGRRSVGAMEVYSKVKDIYIALFGTMPTRDDEDSDGQAPTNAAAAAPPASDSRQMSSKRGVSPESPSGALANVPSQSDASWDVVRA